MPAKLTELAEAAKADEDVYITPRTLLSFYGYQRRGSWISYQIRLDLNRLGVITNPDFESAYIDSPMSLLPKPAPPAAEPSNGPAENNSDQVATEADRTPLSDVALSHRISRLRSANNEPVTVKPDDEVKTAVTQMLAHDYSQLPVTTTAIEVKGMISWRSIGRRLATGSDCEFVRDCMEPHREVISTSSLFDVIQEITKHDCVLVRNSQRRITGIVTAADISEQFRTLAEPFLLLGDIEHRLRLIIEHKYDEATIKSAADERDADRTIESVADLTFGEYSRLLSSQDNWNKLEVALDRKVFHTNIEAVRQIRNDVMHFDPDGITEDQLDRLRKFNAFLEAMIPIINSS